MADKEKIKELYLKGESLASIGRALGISRERVRQLVNILGLYELQPRYTTGDVARAWGMSRKAISRLIKLGRLKPDLFIGGRAIFFSIPTPLERRCTICNSPLTGKKRKYCSTQCYKEGKAKKVRNESLI